MLMTRLVSTVLALGMLTQAPTTDAAKKDLKNLQGTWNMTALEVNGQVVDVAKIDGTVLTIKDTDYAVTIKDQTRKCRIVLDPTKDPKEIDMVFKEADGSEKVHKGVYRLDGDTLKICRGLDAAQARPNQFATWPDTNVFVVTWKRGK